MEAKVVKRSKLVLAIFVFGMFGSGSVLAQDVQSDATVGFQANNNPLKPIDPEIEKPIVPVQPPNKGPLGLSYASNISFGKKSSKNEQEVFFAKLDTVTNEETGEKKDYPNFVQVWDLRGKATGRDLSVRQNGQLHDGKGNQLEGAYLTISARSIVSHSGMKESPTGLKTEQKLVADGSATQDIVKAESGTGVGAWSVFLGEELSPTDAITLTIPKSTKKVPGVYSTTLTWFLQDVL